MRVPFIDLNAQYRQIRKDIDASFNRLFAKGDFIFGDAVRKFEAEFARYCGVKYAVSLNSGTDALFLGLLSLNIKEKDEVIVPALTYIASALAVSMCGARVVFVDIDEETYNIDTSKIEKAVTKKTKAIVPVHFYGQVADMQPIIKIAKKYNLKIVEDAAQAHGAQWRNRNGKLKKAGSIGNVGCFSFYPTKNLGAFGDGGIVTTNDEAVYKRLIMLRDYGRKDRYAHIIKGYNSRLDSIQAIILRAKLKHLDKWNKTRQKNAQIYNAQLSNCKKVIIPKAANYSTHIYHIYGVRVKNRNIIYEKLKKQGIGVLIHYPIPLHLQKAYKELSYRKGDFPVAEKVASQILSLPMYPHIKKEQIKVVVDKLKGLLNER